MTKVSGTDNIFVYTLTDNYTNVIFNAGSNANQTGNLSFEGNGKIYDLQQEKWSVYEVPTTTTPTSTTNPTSTTVPGTTVPSSDYTVYMKNSAKWSTPKCYMWNTSSDINAVWSGEVMTNLGDDVWSYTSSKSFANCIFSDNGSNQSADLTTKYGQIYDNQSKSWSVYDTSAIRVSSYTADPASNIYTGTEVALSATATSAVGTVSYKFSVNGTTIRDFSTKGSATWTPTAAGDYTITFDFKDSEGNENSRTLTLSVASDSGVTSPIIKKVTPSNSSYIKKGQSSTINVTAGGKTGTNLLFYKYVIVDPSGTQNTAYYTLNKTYSFTPTKRATTRFPYLFRALTTQP